MAKRYHYPLTNEEQERLRNLIAKLKSQSVFVKRAFILLAADENQKSGRLSDEEIRTRYHVGERSLERARQRFVEDGLEIALNGKKRTRFKDKTFDGRVQAGLMALRCQNPPDGCQRWSLPLLAEQMTVLGIVEQIWHESVSQLLKKTN